MPDADDDLSTFLITNSTPDLMSAATISDDGLMVPNPEGLKKIAHQQAPADVADWAVSHARPMAGAVAGPGAVTGVAWRGIPSTCVVCTDDRTILPDSQRHWAKDRATHTVEVPFDHCPQVSHPS